MLCIFQEGGNTTSYTAGNSHFVTLKGPYHFGPSFFAGYGVFRFVPLIQTWSPSLYGLKFLLPNLPFLVTSCALTIACIASSQSLFNSEICVSTVTTDVVRIRLRRFAQVTTGQGPWACA